MVRKLPILAAILMVLGLAACGNAENSSQNEANQTIAADASQEETTDDSTEQTGQSEKEESVSDTPESSDVTEEGTPSKETESSQTDSDVLVVYFSATGTTKGVAEKLQASRAQIPTRSRPHRSTRMQIWTGMIQVADQPRSRMIPL